MRTLAAAAIIVLLLLGSGIAALAVLPPVKPTPVSVTVPVAPRQPAASDGAAGQSGGAAGQQGSTPSGTVKNPNNQSMNNHPPISDPSMQAPGMAVTALNPAVKRLLDSPAPTNHQAQPKKLSPAPMSFVEEPSPFGPLPRISPDGRMPMQVYARPSPYRAKRKLGGPARVAVLIEGLDLPGAVSQRRVDALPPAIDVAFSPYGDHLQRKVNLARAAGHEVLMSVPLEPRDYPAVDPGPHTLLTTLSPDENKRRLRWCLARFSGYVGVTNYMGARFEENERAFEPMLAELKSRGLLYLDDGTVHSSQTPKIATALSLAYALANVRIRQGESPERIDRALGRLEADARERGSAIAVADGGNNAVREIARWAGGLRGKGVVLVPVSAAILSEQA